MKKNFLHRILLKTDNIVKVLVIVAVFCLIAVLAHNAVHDLDIWLHLKAGEYIFEQRAIPTTDIFSFTLNNKPWVDHEWFFQVIIYLINLQWQADGLVFLQSLTITLAFLMLFIIGYRTTGRYLESAILIIVTVFASINRFNIRPDIFSLAFFSFYLYILSFYRQNKFVWLLVPVQIIWVNFHGYFFLGPLLVFIFVFSEFLRRNIKKLPWAWGKEGALADSAYLRLKRLLAVLILAGFLNPAGVEGALYPVYIFKQLLTGENKLFFQHIQELQPVFTFNKFDQLSFFYCLIGLCVILMLANLRRLKIFEILLFVTFFPFALRIRNVAFLSFVCYVIAVVYFADTLKRLFSKTKIKAPSGRNFDLISNLAIAVLFLSWLIPRIGAQLSVRSYDVENKKYKDPLTGINQDRYPKMAVDFVMTHDIPDRMFNDFNSGAYLIGRAYPQRRVFIDGRTEMYGQNFFHSYIEAIGGNVFLFNEIVNTYAIEAVLVSYISSSIPGIIPYLYNSPNWKLVFFDENGAVFLKDIPRNQKVIKKYKIDFKDYKAPVADLRAMGFIKAYPRSYLKRANLFEAMKQDNAEIAESIEALRIMPNCAEAYNYLGKVYSRQKELDKAFFNLRSACILAPGNLEMRMDLANTLKDLGDINSVKVILKGIIKRNSRYAPAYFKLGRLYLSSDDENAAIKMLAKAVKFDSNNAEYSYKLAEALYIKGRKERNVDFIVKSKKELDRAFGLAVAKQNKSLLKKIRNKLQQIVGK